MGSMNFNAPPLKMTILAIGVVVALHILTAMALVAIKPSTPAIEPPEVTPPIEIQMVTLPVEIEEPEISIDVAEPEKEIQPKPVTVAKAEPNPQVVKKSQPVAKAKPPVETPVKSEPKKTTAKPKTQPDSSKVVKKEPFRHEVERQQSVSTIQADALAADNDRKILAAQTEKNKQQAHAKAMRDAQAAADAKTAREAQAIADAKAIQEAKAEATARVAKEAEAAARNKAAVEAKAAAAASNKPANFEITPAHWLLKPNFSSVSIQDYNFKSNRVSVVLSMSISANGSISNIKVKKSSGNHKFDRELTRKLSQGKLKPFDRGGLSVEGNAVLPLEYEIPPMAMGSSVGSRHL